MGRWHQATFGDPLSPRQMETLVRTAHSEHAEDVGQEMGIRPRTVRVNLGVAYKKLGARDKFEAFRICGWLRPPPIEEYE